MPTRQILSPHARDAAGIGLVVLALLAILGVWLEAAGPVGHGLSWLLHGAFGVAAVVFPIVAMYWGFVLLRDVAPEDRIRMFIGFTIDDDRGARLLSLSHGNPRPFGGYDATKKLHGLAEAGGLVGALAAYPLSRVLSAIGVGIVCGGLAFLGLLIFTGTPCRRSGARSSTTSASRSKSRPPRRCSSPTRSLRKSPSRSGARR